MLPHPCCGKIHGRGDGLKKRKKFLATAVLVAAAAAIYCNFSLDLEDWTIQSSRIPVSADGLRITLLTDVHGDVFGAEQQTLLAAVRRAEPDLICISGDLADESTELSDLEPLLKGLCATAPTYYVTGNHEWRRSDTEAMLQQFSDWGVTVLRNDYVVLDSGLVLAGAEDPNGYADMEQPDQLTARIRQEVGGDPYIIMLYHRNDALDLWAELDTDLVLSGHGHGGVIRLPFIGGLLGVDRRLFPDNAEGLYHSGRTTLAVSRGLGGIRLWNRPHLPTIVLKSGSNP